MQQAHATADMLASTKVDVLISSSLKRAVQTAEIISSKAGLLVEYDDRIVERNVGEFHGTEFDEKWDKVAQACLEDYQMKMPGGESIQDLYDRSEDFLADITKKYP